MENLSQILIQLLSLKVDVPRYYRQSDGKNIIGQVPLSLSDLSGFLLYKDATVDLSACIIVNPSYNRQLFIDGINTSFSGLTKCDLQYQWWPGLADSNIGNPDSSLYNYDSFANFFLSWIAWQIFKHPLSQAGICNDAEIINSLNSQNVGNGFINSILGLSGETLGSLYYELYGNDPERFTLTGETAETAETVSAINNRFSLGIRKSGVVSILTVNISNGSYDISGFYNAVSTAVGNVTEDILVGISGESIGFYLAAAEDPTRQFAITFLGSGVAGSTLGFSDQGSYSGTSIWAPGPINLNAGLNYKTLPLISGDRFRFEIELQGYTVLNNGTTFEEKGDTLFTISLLLN
jgi:hypothetical protein